MHQFELTGGTVTGADHRTLGCNNQDAYYWQIKPELVVGAVADGCGSGRYSEVGAHLGVRLWADVAVHSAADFRKYPDKVLAHVTGAWRKLAILAGTSAWEDVLEYWLFTLVAFVATPARTYVLAAGDGVVSVNGSTRVITSDNNAPRYIAYTAPSSSPCFQLVADLPTAEVSSIVVGTDGVAVLDSGMLSSFCSDDRYYRNPQLVTRKLATLAEPRNCRMDWEHRRMHREPALIRDDASLVVLRRRSAPASVSDSSNSQTRGDR